MGKLTGVFAFSLVAGSIAAAVQAAPGPRPSAALCGGSLWRLKTLSDQDRNAVRLAPRPTTIAAILQRHAPRPIPKRRTTPFQRQAWEVPAQITRSRREGNELRLELFDNGAYMNAVVPAPICLSRTTRSQASIAETWKLFMSKCGLATRTAQPLGAVVFVTGIGYWSQQRLRHGEAPNGGELHPVTGLRPVAGCGS